MASATSQSRIYCGAGLQRDGNRLLFSSKGGRIILERFGRAYAFDVELAVDGVFLYVPNEMTSLTPQERSVILDDLTAWMSEVAYVPKPEAPVDYSVEDDLCIMADCTLQRLKGRYLCRSHLKLESRDRSLLHFLKKASQHAV